MRKRIQKTILATTKLSFYWLSLFLLAMALWIERKFGKPDFEQIIYHIQFGLEGIIDADRRLIKSFIRSCIIYPAVFTLLLYLYENFIASINNIGLKETLTIIKSFLYKLLGRILKLPGRILDIIYKISNRLFKLKLPLVLIIVSAVFFLSKVAFWSYLKNLDESNFVAENYVTPQSIKPPINKKNLILIYVESLDNSYSDELMFGEDLLASLNTKTHNRISFSKYHQTFGTGWTIAGIVGTQCGIPLRTSLMRHAPSTEKLKRFLPGVVCLGDILKDAGYKNIFMEGADLSFAGKGIFLQDHGYTELYGLREWRELGEKNFSSWGLYDDDLLEKAKQKVTDLEKNKDPYNLTILTVDTHLPGHINTACKKKGVYNLPGVIKCTANLIADFIDYMIKNDFIKNTNIIILGDHLIPLDTMDTMVLTDQNRTIFNKFISSTPLEKNRDKLYHFSMFPTILYSLGFRFENNRLGLGASGFGWLDPNLKLELEHDEMYKTLSKYSKKYMEFWQVKKP